MYELEFVHEIRQLRYAKIAIEVLSTQKLNRQPYKEILRMNLTIDAITSLPLELIIR